MVQIRGREALPRTILLTFILALSTRTPTTIRSNPEVPSHLGLFTNCTLIKLSPSDFLLLQKKKQQQQRQLSRDDRVKRSKMALPRNPAGDSYGPNSGNPQLYPAPYEHLRPTVSPSPIMYPYQPLTPPPSCLFPYLPSRNVSLHNRSNDGKPSLTQQTEHNRRIDPSRKEQHGHVRSSVLV